MSKTSAEAMDVNKTNKQILIKQVIALDYREIKLENILLKAFYTKLLQTQRNFVVQFFFLIVFGLAFIAMIQENKGEKE